MLHVLPYFASCLNSTNKSQGLFGFQFIFWILQLQLLRIWTKKLNFLAELLILGEATAAKSSSQIRPQYLENPKIEYYIKIFQSFLQLPKTEHQKAERGYLKGILNRAHGQRKGKKQFILQKFIFYLALVARLISCREHELGNEK